MADVADQAQAMADHHLARALASRPQAAAAGESRTHCEDCGASIPEARRLAAPGCTRCAECQADFEAFDRRV